ncbi:MAG: hypothetical protein OIN86_10280 [Candidatus Methanoperedens sp.]|nr:hypothetical protein [Candidatus Methanoperedens sp.]
MEINAHNKKTARLLKNHARIRALPKRVSYKNGIIIFDCIDDGGQPIELRANSERPVVYLHEYKIGLSKGWIDEVKRIGSLDMVSNRKKDDPINWIVCDGFIACFVTDDFDFIEIGKIQSLLKIPPIWNLKIIEDEKGLFGGQFELTANEKRIDVNCGVNNGNDSAKIEMNGNPIQFDHDNNGNQKIADYLNQLMNETPINQTIPPSEERLFVYFKQARIELGLNVPLIIDDVLLKMSQIANAKRERLVDSWEKIAREKIKNEWATKMKV